MRVEGATVLITGSNRGLGRSLVRSALASGAAKVYAAARDTAQVETSDRRVHAVRLDLADPASVQALGAQCEDSDILINNAAYLANASALRADIHQGQLEMQTNYWGLVHMIRTFEPILRRRGGGAIVNILSIGALASVPFCSSYCASKAAAWSLTQGARAELAGQGIEVLAVFPGPIATEMARPHELEGRCPPDVMASAIMASIDKGQPEIFPDPSSAAVADQYGRAPWRLADMFANRLS